MNIAIERWHPQTIPSEAISNILTHNILLLITVLLSLDYRQRAKGHSGGRGESPMSPTWCRGSYNSSYPHYPWFHGLIICMKNNNTHKGSEKELIATSFSTYGQIPVYLNMHQIHVYCDNSINDNNYE